MLHYYNCFIKWQWQFAKVSFIGTKKKRWRMIVWSVFCQIWWISLIFNMMSWKIMDKMKISRHLLTNKGIKGSKCVCKWLVFKPLIREVAVSIFFKACLINYFLWLNIRQKFYSSFHIHLQPNFPALCSGCPPQLEWISTDNNYNFTYPRLSPAQYILTNAESWPKTPNIYFILFIFNHFIIFIYEY